MSRSKRSAADKTQRFSLTSTLRRPWKTSHFFDIASAILGTSYTLSIVLIGNKRARTLNARYRNRDYAANVLSFPLSKASGELFLNIPRAVRESKDYGFSPRDHVTFLFIHGCLHLRGYDHGSTMERAERKFIKRFILR